MLNLSYEVMNSKCYHNGHHKKTNAFRSKPKQTFPKQKCLNISLYIL